MKVLRLRHDFPKEVENNKEIDSDEDNDSKIIKKRKIYDQKFKQTWKDTFKWVK